MNGLLSLLSVYYNSSDIYFKFVHSHRVKKRISRMTLLKEKKKLLGGTTLMGAFVISFIESLISDNQGTYTWEDKTLEIISSATKYIISDA